MIGVINIINKKIADVIWFSRVIVNSVLNWKQKMSRLMKYAIRELTEKDVDYQIILRKNYRIYK